MASNECPLCGFVLCRCQLGIPDGKLPSIELSMIESWLRGTTEEYEEWDWTGNRLYVFMKGRTEIYSREELEQEGII